jgi:hypothetical protein
MRFVVDRNVVMRRIPVLAAVGAASPLLGSPRKGQAAHYAVSAFVLDSLCRFVTRAEHARWRVRSASPPTSLPPHPSGNTSSIKFGFLYRKCLCMHGLEIKV